MVPGWQQLLLVLVIVLVLFGGRGRISSIMTDMAKGIRSFRKGLNEDDDAPSDSAATSASLKHEPGETVDGVATDKAQDAATKE
ncbi:MAG: twin-arginine translocase TatA/TatE family subunit [Pseudomonadota bacterium]